MSFGQKRPQLQAKFIDKRGDPSVLDGKLR